MSGITYSQLKEVFGVEHIADDDDGGAEWCFQFLDGGDVFEIYDRKSMETKKEDVLQWHISGPASVPMVRRVVSLLQNELSMENIEYHERLSPGLLFIFVGECIVFHLFRSKATTTEV